MAIMVRASGGGDSKVLVPEGEHLARLVDVTDLGKVEVEFKGKKEMKHKVRFVYLTDKGAVQKRFTLSLWKMAALRQWLGDQRGKKISEEEAMTGIELETLIGTCCWIQIEHSDPRPPDGRVWANITRVRPCKGDEDSAIKNLPYIRQPVRKDEEVEPF